MGNYFVDCYNGSDAAAGTSWATAWRTLDNAILSIPTRDDLHTCYLAPGFYRLETRDKPQSWGYAWCVVRIVGLGGVVIDSVDHTAGFRKGYSGTISFYNVVFKPNTIFCDYPSPGNLPAIKFFNCDLHNGSIVLGTILSTTLQAQFRYCSFQGVLPAIPSTISADVGPFRVISPVTLQSASVQEKCVFNKVPNDQGFLTNSELPLGASVILPSAAQYDAAGPSFVRGDLLPDGLSRRFTLGLDTSIPQQFFSGWVVDPTGPVGAVTKTDDYGITLTAGDGVRCLSPVLHYGMGLSLTRILMTATEFGFGGLNQVIDSTPADATRTLEYRVSDTPFTQTELSPAWNTVTRNVEVPAIRGKYFQFRITFNLEAM